MANTALYDLLQIRVGENLRTYITTARNRGRSWRKIADNLTAVSGMDVSHESLRRWYKDTT